MVESAVFSRTVTARVEPDSTLGKGSEVGKGGDSLFLEGLGRAGGRTRVSEMEGAFGKQAAQNLQTQMRKLGPGAAHHALPECPKQGRQRKLVLCPRCSPSAAWAWRVGSSALSSNPTRAPCIASSESKSLGHQGSPLKTAFLKKRREKSKEKKNFLYGK